MEFSPELTAFQGLMISADSIYYFRGLSCKAGNEDKIECITDSIRKFLNDRCYTTANEIRKESIKELRKLAFFIILNSDLSLLTEMSQTEELGSVIWTLPTIPKCLMCEIFWKLHFDKFVYETIAYSTPELGLEVASSFVDNIKYFTPSQCLDKLKIIASALYILLCRFHFFNFSPHMLMDKLTIIFNHFQKTLNFFIEPPRSDKLLSLSIDDQYKYTGSCLSTVMLLCLDCIHQFNSKIEFSPLNDGIYMLTYLEEIPNKSLDFKICESGNTSILDVINKCNIALLDKLQELIMNISVDIFCAWSEFDDNGRSLQTSIGELCYKVQSMLSHISELSDHPVVSMMKQISRKPKELCDIINAESIETIVDNINKNVEHKEAWLKALLQRNEIFQNKCAVNCIKSNVSLLNEDESYLLYKKISTHMDDSEFVEYLQPFAVILFENCNLQSKYEILEERFSNNCFIDMGETAEFAKQMTETFNKFIMATETDYSIALSLFLQSPQNVFIKMFTLAIENAQQTNIMLKIMKLLDTYANHYYMSDTESCLIKITIKSFENVNTEAKSNHIINFICSLKTMNCISGTKLLLLVIMPSIHKALLSNDISSLNIQCKLLQDAFALDELISYRAPMLAMLGQILNIVRWKMNTYTSISSVTLDLALDLQKSLFRSYNTEIPEKESNWLKSKLAALQPLNMYYYRQLWNHTGRSYIESVTGIVMEKDMPTVQLVTRLSQILCSTTQNEWTEVWNSLALFDRKRRFEIFCDAVMLIATLEQANRTKSSWACTLYCYRNLIHMIRYHYLTEPLNDNDVLVMLEKILSLCDSSQEDNSEELGKVFIPLFAYLAERRNDYTVDTIGFLKLTLNDSKFLEVITNVLEFGLQ